MELMGNEREKLLASLSVQEDQIRNLKNLLNQGLTTKVKYENLFKRLLDDNSCRNIVIDMMR